MEDMKKLIEKYKRELMELSRTAEQSRSPAAKPDSPAAKPDNPARTPQIIGYVDNMDEDSFNQMTQTANGGIMTQLEDEGETARTKSEGYADLPLSEPREESEPELPYHHQPETPPPDYSNPPTAAEIEAVDLERRRENDIQEQAVEQEGWQSTPMPSPERDYYSVDILTPSPSTQSVPMPAPSPNSQSTSSPTLPEDMMPPRTGNSLEITPRTEIINEMPNDINGAEMSGEYSERQSPERQSPEQQSPEQQSPEQAKEYEPPYSEPLMAQNIPNAVPVNEQQDRGSQTIPTSFPQPQYSSFEDFQTKNTGRGTIIFRVTFAREAMPVENAKCVLTKKFGGVVSEIDTLYTDRSGQTPPRTLPAPPKALSQQYDNKIQPFALYDATVSREGYVDVVLTDIPVFDGVQSIQRVSMIPVTADSMIESISEVNPNAR